MRHQNKFLKKFSFIKTKVCEFFILIFKIKTRISFQHNNSFKKTGDNYPVYLAWCSACGNNLPRRTSSSVVLRKGTSRHIRSWRPERAKSWWQTAWWPPRSSDCIYTCSSEHLRSWNETQWLIRLSPHRHKHLVTYESLKILRMKPICFLSFNIL